MKKILILIIIVSSTINLSAQKQNKVSISAKNTHLKESSLVHVCQLQANIYKDNKMKIAIDFGSTDNLSQEQLREIKTEGYKESFTNIVDAIRYMRAKGWRIIENYKVETDAYDKLYFIMTRN